MVTVTISLHMKTAFSFRTKLWKSTKTVTVKNMETQIGPKMSSCQKRWPWPFFPLPSGFRPEWLFHIPDEMKWERWTHIRMISSIQPHSTRGTNLCDPVPYIVGIPCLRPAIESQSEPDVTSPVKLPHENRTTLSLHSSQLEKIPWIWDRWRVLQGADRESPVLDVSKLSLPVLILDRICLQRKVHPRLETRSHHAIYRWMERAHTDSGIMFMFIHIT